MTRIAVAIIAVIFALQLILPVIGCGYHIVKYDPAMVADICDNMEQTFWQYDARVRPIEPTQTAVLDELSNLQRANYKKIRELTRAD